MVAGSSAQVEPDWASLPDYASLSIDGEAPDVSLLDYAVAKLTPDLLIAVTRLFFPEFVVYDNSVFLKNRLDPSTFKGPKGLNEHSRIAREKLYNHIHLGEGLRHGFESMTDQNLRYIGEIMAKTWEAALRYYFPTRQFVVNGEWKEHNSQTLEGDFILMFWEVR